MIWSKTDAGRAEMQSRALVKERSQRNLLLLIDGIKSEEMLLSNVTGLKPEDFESLVSLGLIGPAPVSSRSRSSSDSGSDSRIPGESRLSDSRLFDSRLSGDSRVSTISGESTTLGRTLNDDGLLDYPRFTAALTQLISSELGLRGFTMTLAVEKANSIEELRDVADRVLQMIRERKGDPVADKARRILFG